MPAGRLLPGGLVKAKPANGHRSRGEEVATQPELTESVSVLTVGGVVYVYHAGESLGFDA